eukprot:Skav215391  [mRNA]  locus=scaffold3390:58530:63276:- [translate_table: standard]
MDLDAWLFDELAAIDWSSSDTEWYPDASYNICVVACHLIGGHEGKYYFQGYLDIPNGDFLQCCVTAQGQSHECKRDVTRDSKSVVRWSISQDDIEPDECHSISDVVLKHAVYVGNIMIVSPVGHDPVPSKIEHPCICFRLQPEVSQLIPCTGNVSGANWALIELFAGGFGGWRQAMKILQMRGIPIESSHAVEIDPMVAMMYCRNFSIERMIRPDDDDMLGCGPLADSKLLADSLFLGDVTDSTWMKTIPRNRKLIAAMSSPCPPWTANSTKDGLEHADGRLFAQAFMNCRLIRPHCILVENVATIRTHRHFETLLKVAAWCGYKLAWETTSDLRKIAPITRTRWLAVFIPTHCDCKKWQSLDFLKLPETSVSLFRAIIPLPETHERELTLDEELLHVYSNPMFVPIGKFGRKSHGNPKKVLEDRVKNGSSILGTFMAMYGSQHCLPPKNLSERGMFTELWSGAFGVRFFSPAEAAILHGCVVDYAFPASSRLGHSTIGNCIAVPHAVLVMSVAFNIAEPGFCEDPRESVMAGLMQRLHADNSIVKESGDFYILERRIPVNHDHMEEFEDGDATELDLSATMSFICGYQVKVVPMGEPEQVFMVEPGETLHDLLVANNIRHLGNMLALDEHGHVFPLNREFQADVTLRFLCCDADVKTIAQIGGCWKVLRQPFNEIKMLLETMKNACQDEVTCCDTMLNPVETMPAHIHEAVLLFLRNPLPVFSLAGFQLYADTPPMQFSHELQRVIPDFRVARNQVTIVAKDPAVFDEAVGNCDRIVNPLMQVLAASKWEWRDAGPGDSNVIGSLVPMENASPVIAVMNPICKSAIHVALAPSICSSGLRVEIILDDLQMWNGTLHPELMVCQILGVVQALLTACGRPQFVTSVNRIRILEDSEETLSTLRHDGDTISFRLTSQSLGSGLHLWGGGGKSDVWKEAKHLLGRELLAQGWSVTGLDDVTSSWLRMIGQNKVYGVLRQQLSDDKRWAQLAEMAKWHGLATIPEDNTKLKAVQKIQRAMRKNLSAKLTANQFSLCEGYFVDSQGEPLPILSTISLDASGVCLMEFDTALGWIQQKLPIISDELTVVTLFNPSLPLHIPPPTEISFPATDSRGRQVSKGLVRFAFEQMFEPEGKKSVLQVWGRSYRNDRGRTEADAATSAQFHFRIPKDDAEQLLRTSGKSVVFLTPKAENHLSHPEWGLIWFREFREAEIAAAKATQHSGFARSKNRYALRVPIRLLDQIAKEVKASQETSAIQVLHLYKVHPIPHDIRPDLVVQWAAGFDWKVKLIKKLGKDAVLLGSSTKVPYAHLSMNGQPVLKKEVSAQKAKHVPTPLLAGPRPAPVKRNMDPSIDTLQESDPWGGYRRTDSVDGDAQSSTWSSAPSGSTRSVDAPTAAKFQAIEQRLAAFEANIESLHKTSQFQTAALETTNNVVTEMKSHIHHIDGVVNSMGQNMAGAIEGAIAKGLEAQEKKMDSKFDRLMQMLHQSNRSKRNTPAPHEAAVKIDSDDDMESPVKEPVAKKEK